MRDVLLLRIYRYMWKQFRTLWNFLELVGKTLELVRFSCCLRVYGGFSSLPWVWFLVVVFGFGCVDPGGGVGVCGGVFSS